MTRPDTVDVPLLFWSAVRGQPEQASDPSLAALVERFGLLSVYVPAPGPTPGAQDQARGMVARLAGLLDAACERLGVEPSTWGRVAPVLRAMERLDGLTTGGSAQRSHGGYSRFHRRVSVAIGAPDAFTPRREARLRTTLVHEWVHALDHWAVYRHGSALPMTTVLSDCAAQPLGPLATVAPDALLRSATLMAGILNELNGRTPPVLDDQPWSRFRAWTAARQWQRAAQQRDAQVGRPYYARGSEQLARVVQFHQRANLTDLLRLPLGVAMGCWSLPDLPNRPLHGTVARIRAWMAHEGVGTEDRLVPDGPATGRASRAVRPRRYGSAGR